MGKIDPVLKLLACLLVFMVIATLTTAKLMPNDGSTFTAMFGLASAVSGYLGAIIKARYETAGAPPPAIPPPGSTVKTTEVTTATATTEAERAK